MAKIILNNGETREIGDRSAAVLVKLGKAQYYQTREIKAETDAPRKKRAYKRRDLRAED